MTLFILIECAETNATADKSGQTNMEEFDYFRNQTFTVFYQEVTPEYAENKTEKLHSGIYCSIKLYCDNNYIIMCIVLHDAYEWL